MTTKSPFKDIIVEDKEKELREHKKKQKSIGIATKTLNRLPIFEPSLKPQFRERTFENTYGRVFVRGRLGQSHKNLLEVLLYKRKAYSSRKDEEGNRCFEVLYSEYDVRKYLSEGAAYSQERYESLIEDLKQAYIEIETKDLTVKGELIMDKTLSTIYGKQTKSNLPNLKGEEIPYAVLRFGAVLNLLISKELKFSYNPKPITQLDSGISQAVVRFLLTHKRHPKAGYHLKALLENLTKNIEGQAWKDIRRVLKKDANKLESLGVVIDFKKDRLFVINNKIAIGC